MADRTGKRYRNPRCPSKVCSQLKGLINKSKSGGISLTEVQETFRGLNEGEWTTEEIKAFFNLSRQNIFDIRRDQLCLRSSSRNDEDSTSDEDGVVLPKKYNTKGRSVAESEENCSECEGVLAEYGEVSEQIRAYRERIENNQKLIRNQREVVNKLAALTRPDRLISEVANADIGAIPQATVQSGSRTLQQDDEMFQKKKEIFDVINSNRRLVTNSQIQKTVVVPPREMSKFEIRLHSGSSTSDEDSDSNTETKESPMRSCPTESQSREEKNTPPKPLSVRLDPEEAEIQKMEMRDIMRQNEREGLNGLFMCQEQLNEERSGSHNPEKILTDLKKFSGLKSNEIQAYLEYYRKIMGGNLEHQSTNMVVAAILSMFEADRDKQRLQSLMETVEI